MNSDLADFMRVEAERAFPNEACGLVLAIAGKTSVIACRNIAAEPTVRFLIDPEDYAAAADQGEIIGVWHTHANAACEPSEADLAGCEASQLPWYLCAVRKDETGAFVHEGPVAFSPTGMKTPLIGRPYVYGVFDCWELVRDYYAQELAIQLKSVPRREKFWLTGTDLIGMSWEECGFMRVDDLEPQIGDLFVFQTDGGFPNHLAVYIGGEEMLHHCVKRLSRREAYGGFWKKHTVMRLRHKNKC